MSVLKKNIISNLILINTRLFPFFVVTVLFLTGVEAISYTGFIKNHLFLDFQIYFSLLMLSGYLTAANMNSSIGKRWNNFDFLVRLVTLFFPALLIIGTVFISIERANYRGYVYTHGFHLDPNYFFYLYAICVVVFLIDVSTKQIRLKGTKFLKTPSSYLPLLVLIVFFFLIYQNIVEDISAARPKIATIIKHPFADDVWKGRYLYADFYDFMRFVVLYTPPDAVIMRMPQQSKWPTVSNDGYVRGFIYPRYTKAGDNVDDSKDEKITYVFIHRAYGPPRVDKYIEKWPTFYVPAKRILYMDGNDYNKPPIILEKDYDPNDHAYDDYWGIIELDK